MSVFLAVAALCHPGHAANDTIGPSPEQLSMWEDVLHRAGAVQSELVKFEDIVRPLPTTSFAALEGRIRKNPSSMVRFLRSSLREDRAPAPTPIFPGAVPKVSCESLRGVTVPDTTIDGAGVVAVDGSCRVTATVVHPPGTNRITIFIALPSKAWNGRFMGTGGAGYAGGSANSLNFPASKGYAVGATDTGNAPGTAKFAMDSHGRPNWDRMRDNGYIGIHDMTVVGKALTEAFYGTAPRYSYFFGGSTGGRQGLTEAQRFPKDYDGILALYPAIARDRYVPAQLWPQIVMREANDFLSAEKRDAVTAAAVKACDADDGVVDGVIDDPTRCQYDPASLVGTKIGNGTFTAADAQIVRDIWEGPKAHDASRLWWGLTPGSDLSVLADTSGIPPSGKPCEEGLDWFRYFLMLGPDWDWKTLTHSDFELLFHQSVQEHAAIYGGDDPDLSGLRDRNGKLLIVHGYADQIVPPQKSIAYLKDVWEHMGGSSRTERFVRLFMVPGGDHGFGSAVPSPTRAIMMDALLQWVEHDHAPDELVVELIGADGRITRTRPIFPYPKVARYKGKGSTNDATNFVGADSP